MRGQNMLFRILTLTCALSGVLIFAPQGMSRDGADGTDSTWPLRLAGDSTWPLRFAGESVDMTPQSSGAVETNLKIKSIEKQTMLPQAAAKLNCKNTGATMQKHAATGQVTVGNEVLKIDGICFTRATNSLEVVATGKSGVTKTVSSLVSKMPAKTATKLRGRLAVKKGASQNTFRFAIECDKRVSSPINDFSVVEER